MKILVLGDSLTFSHNIRLELTWPSLLQEDGHWVTHRGRGGSTINKILDELTEIEDWSKDETELDTKYPFDLCVIQVGIVDVTPRPCGRKTNFILKQLPIFKSILAKLNRSKFFLKYFGKPWVSEDMFLKKFELLQKRLSNFAKKTIFIEIARPAHHLKENCGDFSEAVKKYNKILKTKNDMSIFLNVYDNEVSDQFLLRDGYHLNQLGHKVIYQNILKIVQ